MSQQNSFRKPYNPPVEATWWAKNPFYFRYMLREGTAFAATFAGLELMLGVFLFALCDFSSPVATAESVAPYLWFVQNFLGNPIVILLNIAVLAACLFHAVTWFALMPKAVRVFMNKHTTDLVPESLVVVALYIAMFVTTVAILALAFITMP